MMSRNHIIANVGLSAGTAGVLRLADRLGKDRAPVLQDVLPRLLFYLFPVQPLATSFVYIAGCIMLFLIGSTLPDIDQPDSQVSRLFRFHIPIGHRTWTHSVWPCVLFVLLAFRFRPCWFLLFGYVGHLFFDSFSAAGVCWFYPVSRYITYSNGAFVKKGHVLKFYYAGEASETVFLIVAMVVLLAPLMVSFFPD